MIRILTLISLLLLTACSEQSSQTTQPEMVKKEAASPEEIALIEREAIFGNPTKFQGRVSPDGKWLSWLAPLDGVMNIWVAPAEEPDNARAITSDTGRGIPIHYWAPNSEYVLYTQDRDGDENLHVYRVSLETGDLTDLTPVMEGARATIEAVSFSRPDVILVGLNERDPKVFDLYEINISSGEMKMVLQNPGYVSWIIDNDLTPRFAANPMPTGALQILKLGENPEPLMEIPADDALTSNIVGFNKANSKMYAVLSEGRNTAALFSIDAATGERTLMAEDARADINDVLIDPVSYEVLGYAANYDRVRWQGLTEAADKELKSIQERIPGDLNILSSTTDGSKLVIYADSPQAPGIYYLVDRQADDVAVMFETQPDLAEAPLEPMYALEIPSRDGLTLVSYLTLPAGVERTDAGVPTSPQPMVLNVHGGPWARDSYGFNSTHQWLANRGYAVLSVNYRGSTGFGKDFVNAAVNEFAGKMHDDLIDAVSWAVEQGIAKSDQVAIMGGSYGGYATLVGVTFTPDTFACGVDIVGPSNLVTLVESFPAYWGPALQYTWYKYVGNPEDEEQRADMFNRSPIARVGDIKVPLLIGQGENDPRVTKLESDQIVAAMDEKDLPVTYLNYPDEGHGFARPENRMSFFATSEAFLSECLGGRFEAIGDDFNGSSVQVLHGAEYVPGLPEALEALGQDEAEVDAEPVAEATESEATS